MWQVNSVSNEEVQRKQNEKEQRQPVETPLSEQIFTLWELSREKTETQNIYKKIIAKNFPNLRRDKNTQIHEAQRNRLNPKKSFQARYNQL